MPELPEVETVKSFLESKILGKVIKSTEKRRLNLRYNLDQNLEKLTDSSAVISIQRRAKYLIIHLDNSHSIVIHLGMSGRFTIKEADFLPQKHDHVIFHIEDGKKLVFTDPRRFGMIYIFHTNDLFDQKIFKHLGIEPLSNEFDFTYLKMWLNGKATPIKNTLMDNRIVVGIGNIYASESLFLSGINPKRFCYSLSSDDIRHLVISIKQVLESAILAGGTSLRDFVNGDSKPGYFQQKLFVYGRDKKNCYNCRNLIMKIVQAGRASFYCESCQK